MGLRRLRDTTRVFALSLIWRLFTGHSLWKSWIQEYLLAHSSFWDVRENSRGSWIWRKLLRLRGVAYQFMRHEVRNGESTYFWTDNWMKVWKLIDITGVQGTHYLGILRQPVPVNESGPDIVLWKHAQDDYQSCFSASRTWEKIRDRREKVAWSNVVWFS